MKRKASISHEEATVRELRDNPEFAAEYLRAALEDDDEPSVLLIALRRIAEARGGIAKVAKAAGIERESLYRALSARGNPRLSTLVAVTKAVGLKLMVEASKKPARKPFAVAPRKLGLPPGLSHDNVAKLLDELEGPAHR
jgi:probable addiction module antidote protein